MADGELVLNHEKHKKQEYQTQSAEKKRRRSQVQYSISTLIHNYSDVLNISLYKESRKPRREKIKGKKHGLLLNFAKVTFEVKRVIYD